MLFSSWLRNAKRSAPAARRRTPTSPRQRASFRPRVEALEDRWLPSTLTVTNTHDSGPGSLRAEIAAAHSGDTIVFARRLDGRTITLTNGELDLTKNLTIHGPGAGQLTIRGGSSRMFEVAQNTAVTLSGLTISNGDGVAGLGSVAPWDGYGGGILNHGILTVSGCTVSGNYADSFQGGIFVSDGGGIFSDGTLTLSGCTVSGNEAFYGGGIYNAGTATFISSTLSNNSCVDFSGDNYNPPTEGGGIFNHGTLTVSACTVSGNASEYEGGGIFNSGTATVENSSRITGNILSGYLANDAENLGVLYLDSTSTVGSVIGNPPILI
jgi:hypothetical protein